MQTHNVGGNPLERGTSVETSSGRSTAKVHDRTRATEQLNHWDPENSPNISTGIGPEEHEQNLHSEQFRFQCDICNAEFSDQVESDNHMCFDLKAYRPSMK